MTACLSTYVAFIVLIIIVPFNEKALAVLLAAAVGTVVTVATYREYRHLSIPTADKVIKSPRVKERDEGTSHLWEKRDEAMTEQLEEEQEWLPDFEISILDREVLVAVGKLEVTREIEHEILSELALLEPSKRMEFLASTFGEFPEFDEEG